MTEPYFPPDPSDPVGEYADGAGEVASPEAGEVAPRSPAVRRWRRPVFHMTRLDVLFYTLLILVLAVAAWLRFDAQNWDDYTHLHPDERFLTDVVSGLGGALQPSDPYEADRIAHSQRCLERYPPVVTETSTTPGGVGPYFDADCSTLNPNNLGKGLYVYGEFPLFTVHAAGVARSRLSQDYHAFLTTFDPDAAANHTITTHWEGYSGVQLIGRSLSALADWLTVIVLFLLGRRLYGRWTGLLAAAFYAVAAFPIQQAHFWTVDAFTTFWVLLALYFAVRAMDGASVLGGPLVLGYLALWAGAVTWETGWQDHPVLGLVVLGVIFLVTLGLAAVVRRVLEAMGLTWGGILVAASGLMASLVYLVVATGLALAAPRDFPLGDGLIALGFAALMFGVAALVAYIAADLVRRQQIGQVLPTQNMPVLGALILVYMALAAGAATGALSPWATLLIGMGSAALVVFDLSELTDYAVFGVALGGAVASRINIAPLAVMIGIAAVIRVLPALDARLARAQRSRLIVYAATGVMTAAVMSMIVFRLLQPHAFLGPGLFGLKINPGWREDINESAYLTSGNWDAPPNHQWASRTPYLFPWRNIVEWGFGIPLGLAAWIAWAWAGVAILRGRGQWTRHAIPFVWILLMFGWLGGRWVTTMRYFLPIYPSLALLAAWGLGALVVRAWKAERPPRRSRGALRWGAAARKRAAFGAAAALLIGVLGYTTLYGFGFHQIERRQLTRVAASRWFQEFVPGDFGLWVEGDDGTRQMVNLGRGFVSAAPSVYQFDPGQPVVIAFSVQADSRLDQIRFYRLGDPDRDPDEEVIRVRVLRDDLTQGRLVLYEGAIRADFNAAASPYGGEYVLTPPEPLDLPYMMDPATLTAASYMLEVTADDGPVMAVRDVVDAGQMVISDVTLNIHDAVGLNPSVIDLTFPDQPLLTGHGDDIPEAPTHWTVGGSDQLSFTIPIDGEIRTMEIPHLGDPLRDADAETIRLTLIGSDGVQSTSVVIEDDFNVGADPLGPSRVVTFDPPLRVRKLDDQGVQQMATLVVEALDPVYTSGPVIAWEGDWDDPIPWPVCPLADDVVYRDDLPSGLSRYNCASVGMYGSHYQGIKLWIIAEDNEQKYGAMTNALDQADYIVITSNRFYDSLTRIPMRWPMTEAYYEALFDGRLGFELVKTFESYPGIGPITLPDQILPTDDLPDWLNEHWEAEEAFHVYDHPVVMVFKKTADYSPEALRAVLDSVSIRQANTVVPGYVADPNPVGVVGWGAKQASEAPTLLQLSEEKRDIQTDNGTWSDLFDTDALVNEHQWIAVHAWWLLMVIAGWIAWPLLFSIFPALPDRAYPAAKITAWLVVAWVAWVGGTFDILTWTRPGLAVILAGLAALSGLVIWRRRGEFGRYIRFNWRYLLATEALTLGLFLFFLWVRLGNPDLWHNSFGGEKPMDFAYFNGVLRSTVFPPIDPWNAGGYINYYYFGYVVVGAPVKLLGIVPSVAYNLIIPALYAMTGGGVFSIAYNWVRARAVPPGEIAHATRGSVPPPDPAPADVDRSNRATDQAVGAGPALPETANPWVAPTEDDYLPEDISIEGAPNFWSASAAPQETDHEPAPTEAGISSEDVEPGRGVWPYASAPDTPAAPVAPPPRPPSGKRGSPRLPAGSAWLAGILALMLALLLGNLGTLNVIVTGIASMPGEDGQPRWTRGPLYNQVRLAEIEPHRTEIYDDFFQEESDRFREEHGREAQPGDEALELIRKAQERTDAHIHNYAYHPPVIGLWQYEFKNLRAQLGAFFAGLADVMRGKPIPLASNRWHWGPTRLIAELPNGAGHGAIAEMPYFTFLYGDLHAHMLAFPITLLVILWVLAEITGAGYHLRRWWEAGLALGLGALAVGVLRPTNTWDWITYLILGVAGLTFVAWLGAVRAAADRPPSEAAARVWGWIMPGRLLDWWPALFAFPVGLVARIGWYLLRRMQADQQAQRPLYAGEEVIHPSLTVGSALVWGIAALVLVGVVYVVLLIALRARVNKGVLLGWIGRVALFVGLVFLTGLPFTAYFATAYNSVKPWESDTTPLWAYMYIHGTFMFIGVSFLVWQTGRWLRGMRVRQLEGMLVPALVVVGGLIVTLAAALVYGVRTAPVAEVALPLIAWGALMFFLPRQHPLLRAIYALMVLALAISLGVEIVVLDGDIGRQNTVFKFYLQVWFMLSIVGGVTLAWMLQSAHRWHAVVRSLWQGGLAILFSVALLYPIMATQARFQDRFNQDMPLTLDGLDYMKTAVHGESGLWFSLEGDYEIIRWLQENVQGTPVVAEGRHYPSEYHWGGRISINTGLPSILGWSFHQRQQHSLPDMDKLIQARENNVAAFYEMGGSAGIVAAEKLIDYYHIEYIVVGAFERAVYDDIIQDGETGAQTVGHSPGIAKFDTMVEMGLLEVMYNVPRCTDLDTDIRECPYNQVYYDTIYHVVPGAEIPAGLIEQ